MVKLLATIAIIIANIFASIFFAGLSFSPFIMGTFFVTNILTACVAIGFAFTESKTRSYVVAMLPIPLAFAISISWGIAKYNFLGERHWNEDVSLSNGKIVSAERWVKDGGFDTFYFNSAGIKINVIGDETIQWSGSLNPTAIDIGLDGKIYLVAAVENADGQRKYSIPDNSSFAAFEYTKSTGWQRILISNVPPEIHTNLLRDPEQLLSGKRYSRVKVVDLSTKRLIEGECGPCEIWPPFHPPPKDR